MTTFGPIILLGSGEAAPSAHKIHRWALDHFDAPVPVAILETPAGFEPNSAAVAGKVGTYLEQHLQNFQPQIQVIPARKRGTDFSPDDSALAAPLLAADYIFLGPGSPSYAVRQLQDSYAWHALTARHRLGAALCFSSACTIAAGKEALPIYEIYKVGEDVHWKSGLDFFAPYGLSLVLIPHWNNTDGGSDLDTSHCYVGTERYDQLVALLPEDRTLVGIDENTALVISPQTGKCRVLGLGGVVIIRGDQEHRFKRGQTFPASLLGNWQLPDPQTGIPDPVWADALAAQAQREAQAAAPPPQAVIDPALLAQAQALMVQREAARNDRDWATADDLRGQIAALGFQLVDTPDGPQLG